MLRNESLEQGPASSKGFGDFIFNLFNTLQKAPFFSRLRERMAGGLAREVFGGHDSRQLAIEGAWLAIENQGRRFESPLHETAQSLEIAGALIPPRLNTNQPANLRQRAI